MKATVTWQGGRAFEGETESGHRVLLDASLKAGGGNRGPSPMETVLVALGGCTGIDVVAILEKMRVQVDDLQVILEAGRAEDPPQVFTGVNMVYQLWGVDLPEDKVKRAIELTQEKYCSVLHMINKTAKVDFRYEINPTKP
ncbi:hypothetical protein SY88_17725 [Clostridiales bacterium PH28_bin88]|nr:hypothetical protein SY88_17725 [Clostridiales bacterium PH28_bin88]